jgi:hypothetical protein
MRDSLPIATCPCCGQSLPEVPLTTLYGAVGGKGRTLLDLVVRRPGLGAWDLGAVLFEDDPEGGPDNVRWHVSSLARRVNARIRPLGWEVSARPHHGYYLQRAPTKEVP